MLSTLTPSCFFVKKRKPGATPDRLASVGVRFLLDIGVVDLDTAERGRGLRDKVIEWKAYVMKRARDLITSWLRLDVTSTSKAPMKWGMVSSDNASPFMASRSRLTIPMAVSSEDSQGGVSYAFGSAFGC